ncbi:hypothetical protein AArcSl_2260 [Halalkaliarchaeum desulfuricum]|uniref:Uncharacterized protein n=1 Tax=Halalkaliarchaeum desulfuricum TaxID=2055893 RepID=A0A343TLB2_9EURY|nr:hypothetical protein [Halalkaliarchaeum desulfuricum]AUX09884.1 hypothetical protein AArcSl_2260 [Halalkaliarchaeum desulfuricum]
MSTSILSKERTGRSVRAYLQLGVATLGTIVILWGLYGFTTIPSMPRGESGFAEGLAILFYGVYVLGGFVVLSVGLLIPQRDGSGIQFSAQQRKLLAYGVVAPIVTVLTIPVGATLLPPLVAPVISVLVIVVAVLIVSGPLATLVALGLMLIREDGDRT